MKTEPLTKAAGVLVAVIVLGGLGYMIRPFIPPSGGGIQPMIQPMNTMPFNSLGPPIDPARAEKVNVVLRVKYIRGYGADKYSRDDAEVLTVFKNRSGVHIGVGKTVSIAAWGGKPGLPKGKSTVYLEPYSPKQGLWFLLGKEAATGTSHVSSR